MAVFFQQYIENIYFLCFFLWRAPRLGILLVISLEFQGIKHQPFFYDTAIGKRPHPPCLPRGTAFSQQARRRMQESTPSCGGGRFSRYAQRRWLCRWCRSAGDPACAAKDQKRRGVRPELGERAELWQSRGKKPKNQEVLCVQYPSLSPLFAVSPPLPFCLFP